jgi:thiamine-monophosphate kinase
MNEGELLGHIYGATRGMGRVFNRVLVGPGDDCAVVQTPQGDSLLLSVDQLIAGRHFEPDESREGIERIAYKAVARSLSDIAAMGGTPSVSLAAAALPASYEQGDALFDAMHRAADRFHCPLVGGDIALTTGPMTLSVTVVGVSHPQRGPVLRSDARVGDGVYVTGALGGSLESGRHLSFTPRLIEGAWLCSRLGERLGAMIDLSDGLGRDAGRIAMASAVVMELDASRLPIHEDVVDPMRAMADGEDYELCFTARGDVPSVCDQTGTPITRVGVVGEARGGGEPAGRCTVRLPTGAVIEAGELGWEHRA